MNFTDDYLKQAQATIEGIFRANRDKLMAANGTTASEFKDDKSVVTEFDRGMEEELKAALQPLDAGVGFEGEEFGAEGNRNTFWLADPIDGTESFVRGMPTFRNMIALIDNGMPVFAMVYRVVSDELFIAQKGKGTFRNGTKLTVSNRPLHRCRVEFATRFSKFPEAAKVAAALEAKVESLRNFDEFLFVVEAKEDVHLVYKDTKPWDNAPRMLLLAETGAKVANIGSDTYDYMNNNWLAANPNVFDEIAQTILDAEKA
jgi:fructose-1,6-bisphosphatase/inositol monophosphatase family enzyme